MQAQISVIGLEGTDGHERADLASDLRDHLLTEDVVDEVQHPPVPAPDGGKGTFFEWTQLVVTLAGSLPALITAIRAWQTQSSGASVSVSIDGDEVTLTDATPAERTALVNAWLRRHGE